MDRYSANYYIFWHWINDSFCDSRTQMNYFLTMLLEANLLEEATRLSERNGLAEVEILASIAGTLALGRVLGGSMYRDSRTQEGRLLEDARRRHQRERRAAEDQARRARRTAEPVGEARWPAWLTRVRDALCLVQRGLVYLSLVRWRSRPRAWKGWLNRLQYGRGAGQGIVSGTIKSYRMLTEELDAAFAQSCECDTSTDAVLVWLRQMQIRMTDDAVVTPLRTGELATAAGCEGPTRFPHLLKLLDELHALPRAAAELFDAAWHEFAPRLQPARPEQIFPAYRHLPTFLGLLPGRRGTNPKRVLRAIDELPTSAPTIPMIRERRRPVRDRGAFALHLETTLPTGSPLRAVVERIRKGADFDHIREAIPTAVPVSALLDRLESVAQRLELWGRKLARLARRRELATLGLVLFVPPAFRSEPELLAVACNVRRWIADVASRPMAWGEIDSDEPAVSAALLTTLLDELVAQLGAWKRSQRATTSESQVGT